MQRFWSNLAVQLGKHAILVSVIGLVVTIALGFGITKLEFATGQDSYLNDSDQIAKDNKVYQRLFGGQAMLTVVSMDEGHTVDELFTDPESRAQFEQFHDTLIDGGKVHGVITPLAILEFSDALVSSDDGNPTSSIAGEALLAAQAKEEPGSPEAEARGEDAVATLTRLERGARSPSGPSTTPSG